MIPGLRHSGEKQTSAAWRRSCAASGLGRFQPKRNGHFNFGKSRFMRIAMRHTSGQLGYISDERIVFVAPENDDFIAVHNSNPQLVLDDDLTHLPDLVGFGLGAVALQIDQLGDICLAEHMMTALDSNLKPELSQQKIQVVEINVGIRRTTQNPEQQFFELAHGAYA